MLKDKIQVLADFLGKRDIPQLKKEELQKKYCFEKADVFVLFGGSIIEGAKVFAQAKQNDAARYYIIVGGEGHTTETLRQIVHEKYPKIETAGMPESVVFSRLIKHQYGYEPDAIETASTNCGNNITNLLALLRKKGIEANSIILAQDASMQRRMEAGLLKYAPDMTIINYAVYRAEIGETGGKPYVKNEICGMWEMERYLALLMGEIPRLLDDENGYGPRGKDFIAHVDMPKEVLAAYQELETLLGDKTRQADSRWASK